jgi:hypothetical protein
MTSERSRICRKKTNIQSPQAITQTNQYPNYKKPKKPNNLTAETPIKARRAEIFVAKKLNGKVAAGDLRHYNTEVPNSQTYTC